MPAADVLNMLLAIISAMLVVLWWSLRRWMDGVTKTLDVLTTKLEAQGGRILALEVYCAANHGTGRREHNRSTSE